MPKCARMCIWRLKAHSIAALNKGTGTSNWHKHIVEQNFILAQSATTDARDCFSFDTFSTHYFDTSKFTCAFDGNYATWYYVIVAFDIETGAP